MATQANGKQAKEKGERKRQKKMTNIHKIDAQKYQKIFVIGVVVHLFH
jgi:hypothetical protein